MSTIPVARGLKLAVSNSQGFSLGPTPPTLLWFIRHGEVEEKYQNVFGGRIDMGLSPSGHAQAGALAEYLRLHRFDAIYASPMQRVQQTLAPLLSHGAPRPIILHDLREMDFGDWTGLNWDEVLARYGIAVSSWLEAFETGKMPNAETVTDLRQRLASCVTRMLRAHPGGNVAVFCHGGVIRAVLSILLGWPLSGLGLLELEYASVTQLACAPTRAHLRLANFTPWRSVSP